MTRTLLSLAVALLALHASLPLQAALPADNLGKQIPGFSLVDTTGKSVSLADFKDKKAIVVVFVGVECPINNLFLPKLVELHQEFAAKGVQFLAIDSNRQDTKERIVEHSKKYELPFPMMKDDGNKVADLFNAQRTPEAFLLDASGKVRYRGRIDDRYGYGYKRPKPNRRDLAEAIVELLAGKDISTPTTEVAGCFIGRETETKIVGDVNFTKHVSAILQNRCQECHRPGQIGPMALMNFEDASTWSKTIREVVQDERMPPWHADPRFGKFSNDRRLSAEEKATLIAWVDQGMPRGNDKDLVSPREWPKDWIIGKPDVIITLPEEYDVPAEAKRGVPYQHIFVDPKFTEDKWVVRAEARPGATEVVHHILVFVVPPGKTFFPGGPTSPVLAGTAPGEMPLMLPDGMAKKIPAGSKLVFQMHYTPNGKAQKDLSSLGLIFAKELPSRKILTMPIANLKVMIPPNADNHEIESWFSFREDGQVIAFMPHMHLRGKDFLYEAIYPDGKKETLLSVPRYNFNWQSVYRLEKPHPMPKGSKLHCVAHFDNSAKNPNNPDPSKNVFWGDQTWEEMMIGWIDYVYDRQAE